MDRELKKYISLIEDYVYKNYRNNFREPVPGYLNHKFLVPGSGYVHQLWDWDSWLTGYALMSLKDKEIEEYQKGCVLNFLEHIDEEGRIPILVQDYPSPIFDLNENYKSNIHKPCLAIHALEISENYKDIKWLEPYFDKLLKFISYYENNQKDEESGLFYWIDDLAIGFDNDPSVFYRPDKSTGAIYLNSLMYQELLSVSKLAGLLNKKDIEKEYLDKSNQLKAAINNECFDKVDGFYYSVDLSLRKVDNNVWLHKGHPRFWHSLPIKITTWAGLLPLWNGIASKENADMVIKRYLNKDGLFSNYGIRSVAKNEKMFGIFDTGNPSCWLGPIWINANYFTYLGLKKYGYLDLAKDIAKKTILLLGRDIELNGEFHEYYDSETGVGVRGKGFQSWNFLVLKMIEDLKD
ncbi:MAG: glycoside hydrolase family 37 [Bacilli bacterium]|nr:glycoside hydrolase family 37 [Bacilli bacterium]